MFGYHNLRVTIASLIQTHIYGLGRTLSDILAHPVEYGELKSRL